MWMEAFLEVLFCRAPCCHFTDNPTEPFSINLVKLQNSGHRYVAAATSLILELHVHIPIQSACAEIQCTTVGNDLSWAAESTETCMQFAISAFYCGDMSVHVSQHMHHS